MVCGVCVCVYDVGVIGDRLSECVYIGVVCMFWLCVWCPSMIGVHVSDVCVCGVNHPSAGVWHVGVCRCVCRGVVCECQSSARV